MNVLVVDDTKNIRMLLTKCLRMEGYTVKAADDGRTAVEMLAGERFDLAFLDIKMPRFSGTEVLKKIREMGISTPVIIITAYATVKNAVECTNLGAVAYLQKPFTAEKVKSVLRELLMASPGGTGLGGILRLAEKAREGKNYAEAVKILKSALSDYSLEPELHRRLADAYDALGCPEQAQGHRRICRALTAKTP